MPNAIDRRTIRPPDLERSGEHALTHASLLETVLWVIGLSFIFAFVSMRLWYGMQHRLGIEAFQYAQLQHPATIEKSAPAELKREALHPSGVITSAPKPASAVHKILRFASPHTADWSGGRLAKYWASVTGGTPEAVLKIARLQLEVPVYSGVNELNLNRGAARLLNTSAWDKPGNTAIAAHRDGYFRALRYIKVGDDIEVDTNVSTDTLLYRVEEIQIVDPSAVEVLSPTSYSSLTLITCYPFHHIGPAPKRFIVKARRIRSATMVNERETRGSLTVES